MTYLPCYGTDSIKHTLSAHNIALKKRWGQNFITEKRVARHIATRIYATVEAYYKQKDAVHFWEIGPGLGALTNAMLEEREATQLTLFEVDHGITAILREGIEASQLSQRISLISGDAIKTLIRHAGDVALHANPQTIYGNLPYSSAVRIMVSASLVPAVLYMKMHGMSTDTLLHAVEAPVHAYKDIPYAPSMPMCYMLQKDVAERIMASTATKSYGVTTVLFQSFYHIDVIYTVSPHVFYPTPHVDSVMCAFIPRGKVPVSTLYQRNILKRIVHVSFSQRRKKLSNTLGKFLSLKGIEAYAQLCEQAHISLNARPEEVSPDTYMVLAVLISQYLTASAERADLLL